jgi:hypothetical protein
MRRKTRIRLVRFLKCCWILLHVLALQLTLRACAYSCVLDVDCTSGIHSELSAFVIVSGFPSSVFGMVTSDMLFRTNEFSLFWIAGVLGGYIQWFVVLPRLLKVKKPIALEISMIRHRPIAVDATPLEKSPIQEKIRKIRKKSSNRNEKILQFDTKGRTPLERALLESRLRS